MNRLALASLLALASCLPPAPPPPDAAVDVAGDATPVPADEGVACVATFQAACDRRAPCCAGLVCQAGACLLAFGAPCRFPWECGSDSCLANPAEPGLSRCALPRE